MHVLVQHTKFSWWGEREGLVFTTTGSNHATLPRNNGNNLNNHDRQARQRVGPQYQRQRPHATVDLESEICLTPFMRENSTGQGRAGGYLEQSLF